jgi:GT2 family glycosyltransferase
MADAFPFERYRDVDPHALRHKIAAVGPRVSVVVAVHNGGEVVRSCLQSVIDNSPTAHRIIAIDDGGEDVHTRHILDEFHERGDVELIRHEKCRGYTRTANHGLLLTEGDDVVLLNSDTVVPPMWLQRLSWTAYSEPGIGTVSAVSNDAAANSVPERHRRNDWYPRLEWESTGRLMSRGMRVWSQHVPSAHGFCMYIRRALIRKLGALDRDGFPVGYGEEVDYSQKAILAGWSNVVAPHVLVKHLRSQSFGPDRRKQLVDASKVVLTERYPQLRADVATWESSLGAALVQQNAARVRSGWSGDGPGARTVVVRDLDLQYTLVELLGADGSLVPQDEWCFPANQRRVDSTEALDHAVSEMILLGCAESVVSHSRSTHKKRVLRQLARDLGVGHEQAHAPDTDPAGLTRDR